MKLDNAKCNSQNTQPLVVVFTKKSFLAVCLLLICSNIYGQGSFAPVQYYFAEQMPTSLRPLQVSVSDLSTQIADQAVDTLIDSGRCQYLFDQGEGYGLGIKYRFAYDTLRLYVESCYSILPVAVAFPSITSACSGLEALKDTVWAEYRDWLKSVLYFSSDSFYVCRDLAQYAGTFVHHDERGHDIDYKTCLSILKYLKDSSRCSNLIAPNDIKNTWRGYYGYWKWTLHGGDTVNNVFDSTLPGIDQAGQGFLHGFSGVKNSDGTRIIAPFENIRASKNPFKQELHLSYDVLRPAVAKLEIYDVLGKEVFTNGQGYLEVGEHSVDINSSGWSSGTYYARLVTLQGLAKTLKIVKE